MSRNLLNYYKMYIRRDLMSRFNIQDIEKVAEISYIKVLINLTDVSSLEDTSILKSVECIENLTGQKCLVKDMGTIQGKRGYSKGRNIECFVTLRKEHLYNFLSYMVISVLPIIIKRYGLPKLHKLGKGFYSLKIMDMNSFYKMKLDLAGSSSINLLIKLNGCERQHKLLLKSMGLRFN